jgi:hypothetical protein
MCPKPACIFMIFLWSELFDLFDVNGFLSIRRMIVAMLQAKRKRDWEDRLV